MIPAETTSFVVNPLSAVKCQTLLGRADTTDEF